MIKYLINNQQYDHFLIYIIFDFVFFLFPEFIISLFPSGVQNNFSHYIFFSLSDKFYFLPSFGVLTDFYLYFSFDYLYLFLFSIYSCFSTFVPYFSGFIPFSSVYFVPFSYVSFGSTFWCIVFSRVYSLTSSPSPIYI